ncbi:MAG: PEP-CTERM sorting domain-containing protein, partial [Planctomycetota bacterium]
GLPVELATSTWVDALANHADHLYDEVSHADAATMLVSTTGLPDILYTAPVHHAPIHGLLPETGMWAPAPLINAGSPPDDVDGLEIWGPAGAGGDDADKFSLMFDPAPSGGSRISVWDYSTGVAVPYITAASLAGAIGRTDLFEQIDLDAMMVSDVAGDTEFGSGDSIMFSIAPVDVFDGGEIWVWDFDAGLAGFLVHGGELWDTAHSVVGHFGLPTGGEFENINALEAVVPEPATMSLLAVGAAALIKRRRK